MYRVNAIPDKEIIMTNGEKEKPVLTLADEFGGRAHFIIDDHCYCLVIKTARGHKMTPWIFYEALCALKTLPVKALMR